MKLFELEPDVLIAAVDEDDVVAVIAEQLEIDPDDVDLDDPDAPELRLVRAETDHKRGVLGDRESGREYHRLREAILR